MPGAVLRSDGNTVVRVQVEVPAGRVLQAVRGLAASPNGATMRSSGGSRPSPSRPTSRTTAEPRPIVGTTMTASCDDWPVLGDPGSRLVTALSCDGRRFAVSDAVSASGISNGRLSRRLPCGQTSRDHLRFRLPEVSPNGRCWPRPARTRLFLSGICNGRKSHSSPSWERGGSYVVAISTDNKCLAAVDVDRRVRSGPRPVQAKSDGHLSQSDRFELWRSLRAVEDWRLADDPASWSGTSVSGTRRPLPCLKPMSP